MEKKDKTTNYIIVHLSSVHEVYLLSNFAALLVVGRSVGESMALSKVSFLRFMTLSTATFAAEFGLEALSTQDTVFISRRSFSVKRLLLLLLLLFIFVDIMN